MDCVYCDGRAIPAATTYRLEQAPCRQIIKDNPSYRCNRCKNIYYDFDTACRILCAVKVFLKTPASKRPDLVSFHKLPRKRRKLLTRIRLKKGSASRYRIDAL